MQSNVNVLLFTELMGNTWYSTGRPVGAYRIASALRKAGYTVQVVDFFTKFLPAELDAVINTCVGPNTIMVGYSTTFFSYIDDQKGKYQLEQVDADVKKLRSVSKKGKEVLEPTLNYPYHASKMLDTFRKMKAINPKLKIVLGGAKTQYLYGVGDAFAVGYCDQAIVEYVQYLEGKNPFFQFVNINDKQIAFYGDQYTDKFDFTATTVDWHPSDYLAYGEAVPIEISRGCIFKCKFCAFPLNGKSKNDYIKQSSILKDEFLKNYYEYGITRYIYADDTHNDSVDKLQALHKVVTSLPFEIEYAAYLRHDLIHAHPETAALLRESGLRSAIFGIESLNHESAKAIGKGLHPDKIKDLLYWLRDDAWKGEVATTSGFIIGLPHDSQETIREWVQWLLDSNCPLDSFSLLPLSIPPVAAIKNARIWKSDFEINSQKYGYKVEPNGNWTNENFTRLEAIDLAQELTKLVSPRRFRNSGFPIIMLSNLGYSVKDMIGKPVVDVFNNLNTVMQKNQYVQAYKHRLLGI